MPYKTLIACTDEYSDDLGFNIKGTPDFDGRAADRDGLLTAHDIVEHCGGETTLSGVDNEMMAMGAIWHSRGRWGDFPSTYYSPQETIGADITNMFGYAASGCGPMPTWHKRAVVCSARDYIIDIVDGAKSGAIGEYLDDIGKWKPFREKAIERMCAGYNQMNRRFPSPKYGAFASNNMFNRIREAVNEATKLLDIEGQEFTLRYSCDEAEVYNKMNDYGEWD